MKRRCLNKNVDNYSRYGGVGVTVSKEWMSFVNFYKDMGKSYKLGLSLDRIDNDKGYSKENCRWIPLEEQSRNRRYIPRFIFKGRFMTYGEISKEINIKKDTLRARVHQYGWSLERATSTPVKTRDRS